MIQMAAFALVPDAAPRLAARDVTLWPPGSEAPTRLGWLDVLSRRPRRSDLASAAAKLAPMTALIGMGGSSMAPMMFSQVAELWGSGGGQLSVVDTTHPQAVQRAFAQSATAVAASKSGGTLEVRALLDAWLAEHAPGTVTAVTDPGSPLASRAAAVGFDGQLLADPEVGGRFSALTVFGLLPAEFVGLDVDRLLSFKMNTAIERGAELADALLGQLRLGRDKMVVRVPAQFNALALWLEQLVAESTGKSGRGVVPVAAPDGVALSDTADAFLCTVSVGSHRPAETGERTGGGPDAIVQEIRSVAELGEWIATWEVATALICSAIGVDAFDQPDVAAAKAATDVVMKRGGGEWSPVSHTSALFDVVDQLDVDVSHIGIQAFVDDSPANYHLLGQFQGVLSQRAGRTVSLGFGPRYLHSTGQLHKGGPPGFAAVQVLDQYSSGAGLVDRDLPTEDLVDRLYSGMLIAAQAQGDHDSLKARERLVVRIDLASILETFGERSGST